MRKAVISVHERWFRKYVTDAFGSMIYWYDGQVLDNGLIELLGLSTERYEVCKELV